MNKADSPEIVIIHDIDHGEYSRVLKQLDGLELPFVVTSLTDLVDQKNPYNEGDRARTALVSADRLIIQASLMRPMTPLVRLALAATLSQPGLGTEYGIFDDDYKYQPLQHEQSMHNDGLPLLTGGPGVVK